jgi:hypothetical protein
MSKMKNNSQGRRRNPIRTTLVILIPTLLLIFGSSLAFGAVNPESNKQILEKAFKIQIPFIENQGQIADEQVRFYAKTFGGAIYVTKEGEMIYSFIKSGSNHNPRKGYIERKPDSETTQIFSFKEKLVGASTRSPEGSEKGETKVNYFIGNEQSKWKTNLTTYEVVSLGEVYQGIDLRLKAYGKNVEKIFTVKPGADPGAIKLSIDGGNSLKINENGELEVETGLGVAMYSKPIAYQMIDGKKVEVKVAYCLQSSELVYAFKIGDYDKCSPLIIDPILVYSSYLGGSGDDGGFGIAVDSSRSAYITGYTTSSNFPTANAYQGAGGGASEDAFVTKINPSGNALVYSTYLGGSGDDYARGIAVDSSGNAYITGTTGSSNFPMANAFQSVPGGGGDAFVTKINPSGNALVYSTYLGGSSDDNGLGIAVDSSGNAYITGYTYSSNFPMANALQNATGGGFDAFVTEMNPSGNVLVYSTYFGGSGDDHGNGIAVDSTGKAYITGQTTSSNLYETYPPPVWGNAYGGGVDAFVATIMANGSSIGSVFTYWGGSGDDIGNSIAVSGSNIYITGSTTSTNFWVSKSTPYGGNGDAFVSIINAFAPLYSTYLGGSGDDVGYGLAVDGSGNAYIIGVTHSSNFPVTADAVQSTFGGVGDAFGAKINRRCIYDNISNPDVNCITYSTYLGGSDIEYGNGIAVDSSRNAYITGFTGSSNFPTANALQGTFGGFGDAFVAKISREMIDRNVWADLEFVRRINNGVLESELRRYGANGSNYLVFHDPSTINSFQADVTVKDYQNNGSYPHASLLGYAYKGISGSVTGDVIGTVGIGHNGTQLEGFYSISICKTANCNLPNEYVQVCSKSLGPAVLDQAYTISWKIESDSTFTFVFDGTTYLVNSTTCPGLPSKASDPTPTVDTKGIGTRVTNITTDSEEGGFISATFGNVRKNGAPYGLDDNADGMIDPDKWRTWEFVRMVENGELVSELTQRGVNGSNSTNFINANAVTGFRADVTVTDFVNVGALPTARLTGAFYNDGTSGDGRAGDIISSIGIRHTGTQLVRFYAITQCLSGNCNNPSGPGLPDQYNTLAYEEIPGEVSIGETLRLSLTWNGSQFTFGFDGVLITPSISLSPFVGPPKTPLKGIGTRVIGIEDNPSSDWGYIAATFDNVVVLSMGYPLTVAKSGTGNGTVTSLPGINCPSDCSEIYASGTSVTLTATPAGGSFFAGWSGSGCSGTGTCTVTMDAVKSVTATFTINTYTVTASVVNPAGGSVAPPNQSVDHGGMTTFTVTTNTGYTASVSEGTLEGNTWTIPTVTSTHTVTVTFTINTYDVTASVVNPTGGSVSPPSQNVDHGGTAIFTVTTNPGYTALVSEGTLEGNTWTIPNVTSTHTVTVTFTIVPNPPPTITGITPNYGNTGSIDNFFMIDGTGFMSGATVKLTRSGQSDIFASGYEPIAPTQIRCWISLLGAVEGLWNVVVTNPDTQLSTLTNGFTVNPPGCPTPGMPSNPLPSDGATNRPINQTLNWATSTNADSYDVYFGTSNIPPNPLFVGNVSTVTGTSYAPSGLNPNTTYYWKIVAKNTCFNSTAGPLWSFTTVPGIPAPPILASPGNGETGVGLSPTLVWNAPPGAISSYHLQVSADNFSTFVFNGSVTATSQTLTSPLPIETTYSWRVYATNTQGDSAWSDVWTFITQPAYGNLFEGVRGTADPDNDADGLDDVIHEGPNGLLGNGTVGPDPTKRTLFVKPKKVKVNPDGTEIFPPQYEYWSGFIALFPDSRPGFANIQAFTNAGIEIMVVGDPNSTYAPMREFTYDPGNDSSHPPCDIMEIIYKGPISICVEGSHNNGHTYFYTSGPNWSWDTKGYCPSTAGIHGYKTPRIYPFPLDNYFKEGAYSSIKVGQGSSTTTCSDSTPCPAASPMNVNATNAENGPPDGTVEFNPITFDPSGNIVSITPPLPTTGYDKNTVLRRTTVHEMGHALLAGMDSDHCADPNCIMYTSVADWQMHDFGPGNCVHKSGGSKDIRSAGVIHNSVHGLVATPAPPTLASPADRATNISVTPTLSWNASTGATSYGLQVSTNSSFSPTVVNQTGITSTSRAISGLLNGTTYYWRVNATNAGGTSAWSAPVRSFTTVAAAPPVPTLLSPLNQTSPTVARPITFRWNPSTGATSYQLQVSTSRTSWSGSSLKINQSNITTTSYTESVLARNTTYYWRVRASNAVGTSAYSSVWTFRTSP